MSFSLRLLTPKGQAFSGEVKEVVLPLEKGPCAIFENYTHVIASLEQGIIKIVKDDDKVDYYACFGGSMWNKKNELIVTVEILEHASTIDLARALEAKKRAEERLLEHDESIDMARARAALLRASIRIKAKNLLSGGEF